MTKIHALGALFVLVLKVDEVLTKVETWSLKLSSVINASCKKLDCVSDTEGESTSKRKFGAKNVSRSGCRTVIRESPEKGCLGKPKVVCSVTEEKRRDCDGNNSTEVSRISR